MKLNIKITNLIVGTILIIIGVFLQFQSKSTNVLADSIKLDMIEIDTYYDNNNSIEYIQHLNHINKLWAWPTNSKYYISNWYSAYHPAIDIVTTTDFNIYSSYDGIVITNSYRPDNGNYLVIKQNNGYYILYAHLSQKLVNVGDQIKKGQIIGVMGQTGIATGVHLHFSVWDGYPYSNSNSINPLNFF